MIVNPRIRLIVITGIILLVSFTSVSYLNFRSARRSIENEIVTSGLPLTRENIYSEIVKDLMPPLNISSLMANDSFLIEWATEGERDRLPVITYLQNIQEKYGFFSTFFVSASSKNYYYPNGILKQISTEDDHDVWFYRFIESDKLYDLDVDTNEAAGNLLTIFINYRVEDFQGNILGVTGVGLEMESFAAFLAETQQKYHRRIYLVDPEGYVQAHSDSSLIETINIYTHPGIEEIAAELLTPVGHPVDGEYSRDHEKVLITARYIPQLDWFLIVEQDAAPALQNPRKNLVRTLLTGGITSLIILIIVGVVVSHYQGNLEHIAITDELTGVHNRREYANLFEQAEYRFNRYGTTFSVILIDIDDFKEVNDTIGHLTGDRLLIEISSILKDNIRPTDRLARWGGDEFIILAESDGESSLATAERLLEQVRSADYRELLGREMPVTFSCGVAEYRTGDTIERLTAKADEALYASKRAGRNTITLYKGDTKGNAEKPQT
jgi:diguanylate cyclase (GGDEF)-like protein